MKKIRSSANLLVGLILVSMGLASVFAFSSSIFDIYQLYKSKNWSKAEGVVYFSGIKAGCKYNSYYLPSVKYKFFANGEEFSGWRISLGARSCTTKTQAEQISSKYPEGMIVPVFFDPLNPSYSALALGSLEGGAVPILIFSSLMSIFFITCGYFVIKSSF